MTCGLSIFYVQKKGRLRICIECGEGKCICGDES